MLFNWLRHKGGSAQSTKRESINRLFDILFVDSEKNQWLPLFGSGNGPNFMLIGRDLEHCINGTDFGPNDYLILAMMNKPRYGPRMVRGRILRLITLTYKNSRKR